MRDRIIGIADRGIRVLRVAPWTVLRTAIAPTVLHLMGFPVPASMDGRVLESLFGAEGAESRAVVYDETTLTREVSDSSKVYSAEEADEVRQRLDDLGYL